MLVAGVGMALGCKGPPKQVETVNPHGSRLLVIAFRSYGGSQASLERAANELLTAWPAVTFAGRGSHRVRYDERKSAGFLASATLFRSALPVQGILQALAAVEERLGGPPSQAAPLVKLDLLWVEGVDLRAPELTLPSPLLFETAWANSLFREVGEAALLDAHARGRESASTHRRLVRATRELAAAGAGPARTLDPDIGRATLARSPAGTTYVQAADVGLDALAAAGDLLLLAEMDARATAPKPATDADAAEAIRNAMAKLGRRSVLEVEIEVRGERFDDRAQAWVDGLARALAPRHFVGVRTVVYAADAGRIRGAVLGHADPAWSPRFRPGETRVSSRRHEPGNAAPGPGTVTDVALSTAYLPR